MSRLIDTNILLRYVTQDIQHKAYGTCIRELSEGGTVQLYAFAELSFSFVSGYRKNIVREHAENIGAKEEYDKNPRCYVCKVKMPPGWHKEAAQELRERINKALRTFPNLKFQYWDLVEVALGRMVETGHDCVDCLLYAESILGGHEVVSIDKHLSDVSKVPAQAAFKSIGKMDLR